MNRTARRDRGSPWQIAARNAVVTLPVTTPHSKIGLWVRDSG
jgi:hypothetical protein